MGILFFHFFYSLFLISFLDGFLLVEPVLPDIRIAAETMIAAKTPKPTTISMINQSICPSLIHYFHSSGTYPYSPSTLRLSNFLILASLFF